MQIGNWDRINFTNVLRAAFTREDPRSAKDTDHLIVFALLGCVRTKALSKRVDEIDP